MKMNKRMLKVAVVSALTVAFAVPAFANPFTDVPAKHWAYDSVNKLQQAGIVDGYGDGSFKGDKTITRYEMAQIVAKAMTKSLNADQKASVDKLSKEFATELNTMGVKVDGIQNQINNMIKFDGDARVRYIGTDKDQTTLAQDDHMDFRIRLGATAKINDNMSAYARFNTGNLNPSVTDDYSKGTGTAKIENAYVNVKALGLDAKVGRQDYTLGQGMLAGAAANSVLNGVSVKDGNFMALGGKEYTDGLKTAYGAEYKFNMGAPVVVDYLKLAGTEYAAASTSFKLVPGVKLSTEYAKNITSKADAFQVKAALGTTGFSVAYKDVNMGALPADSALNLKVGANDFYNVSKTGEAKGMEYEYNKDVAKNTNVNVIYQDIQNQGSNVRAAVNVKF